MRSLNPTNFSDGVGFAVLARVLLRRAHHQAVPVAVRLEGQG